MKRKRRNFIKVMSSTVLSNCSNFTISNSNKTKSKPCGFYRGTYDLREEGGLELADVCRIRQLQFLLVPVGSGELTQTYLPPTQLSSLCSLDYPQPPSFPFKSMKIAALECTIHIGTGRRVRETASFEKKNSKKDLLSFPCTPFYLLNAKKF